MVAVVLLPRPQATMFLHAQTDSRQSAKFSAYTVHHTSLVDFVLQYIVGCVLRDFIEDTSALHVCENMYAGSAVNNLFNVYAHVWNTALKRLENLKR